MIKKKYSNCPKCKTISDVVPIKYGLPYNEDFDYVQKKLIILGGFNYDDKSPNWYCKKCKTKWKN